MVSVWMARAHRIPATGMDPRVKPICYQYDTGWFPVGTFPDRAWAEWVRRSLWLTQTVGAEVFWVFVSVDGVLPPSNWTGREFCFQDPNV